MSAENLFIVFDRLDLKADRWASRIIAVGIMVLVTLLHSLRPHTGIRVINAFGIAKIGVLLGIVASGIVVLAGGLPKSRVPDPYANFRHPFRGSATEPYGYAIAALKIVRRSRSGRADAPVQHVRRLVEPGLLDGRDQAADPDDQTGRTRSDHRRRRALPPRQHRGASVHWRERADVPRTCPSRASRRSRRPA